jgi:hypothetical protein
MSFSDLKSVMPEPRMMHESVIIYDKKGQAMLLVLGGKTGPTPAASSYSSSVIGLSLAEFIKGEAITNTWQNLESMICPRANFGCQVINNKVYVFGGISSKSGHQPILANPVCERYDPLTNKWEAVDIQGALPIAAFGWTISDGKMLVVGGTDGEMLQDTVWSLDLEAGQASLLNPMENQIAMSSVFVRGDTLHSIGGYGSGGMDYSCKLG